MIEKLKRIFAKSNLKPQCLSFNSNFSDFEIPYLKNESDIDIESNPYGFAILDRLVTSEIGAGLRIEPEFNYFAEQNKNLAAREDIKSRFDAWALEKNKLGADFYNELNFYELQEKARFLALLHGDCLIILRFNQLNFPKIQLVPGNSVKVEYNSTGEVKNYVVLDKKNNEKKIAPFGKFSNRRVAWLIFADSKNTKNGRGIPALKKVSKQLEDIKSYIDSSIKTAKTNSSIAFFIERNNSVGNSSLLNQLNEQSEDNKICPINQRLKTAEIPAGLVVEGLYDGETLKSFEGKQQIESVSNFVDSTLNSISMSIGLPPEILKLIFTNSYSASRQAIVELNLYLKKARKNFNRAFNGPVYENFLTSLHLNSGILKIDYLNEFSNILNNPYALVEKRNFIRANWNSEIREHIDPFKSLKATELALNLGLSTHDEEAKKFNGSDFNQNVSILADENKKLEAANEE